VTTTREMPGQPTEPKNAWSHLRRVRKHAQRCANLLLVLDWASAASRSGHERTRDQSAEVFRVAYRQWLDARAYAKRLGFDAEACAPWPSDEHKAMVLCRIAGPMPIQDGDHLRWPIEHEEQLDREIDWAWSILNRDNPARQGPASHDKP
jgi:hypothetical protein